MSIQPGQETFHLKQSAMVKRATQDLKLSLVHVKQRLTKSVTMGSSDTVLRDAVLAVHSAAARFTSVQLVNTLLVTWRGADATTRLSHSQVNRSGSQ